MAPEPHQNHSAASLESLIWKPRERQQQAQAKKAGAEQPILLEFKQLGRSLESIRASLTKIEARQKEDKRLKKICRDWSDVADKFERISLAMFLTASSVSLAMFFYHGWY